MKVSVRFKGGRAHGRTEPLDADGIDVGVELVMEQSLYRISGKERGLWVADHIATEAGRG